MLADSNLLSNLAHELRQPLSTIESIAYYLELALSEANPKVRAQLERLRDSVAQSDNMLRDALALAQFAPPRPVTVDLDELFTEFAAPHFDLHLAAAPVTLDFLHARKMVETICSLFAHYGRVPHRAQVLTGLEPSGHVYVRVSGSGLHVAASSLALQLLEQIAAANALSLQVNLRNPESQEISLEIPCADAPALALASAPSALAASAAAGSDGLTSPDTP